MIQVTDRAERALQEVLTTNSAADDQAVRLLPNGQGGLGFTIDNPGDDDEVVQKDDTPILAVSSQVAGHLTGFVLDYRDGQEDGQSAGFVLGRAGDA